MSNQLGDLLAGRMPSEPPEIAAIKQFVREHYDEEVAVTSTPNALVIVVSSSAFAGALRPQLSQLQHHINTDKKLLIRIQ